MVSIKKLLISFLSKGKNTSYALFSSYVGVRIASVNAYILSMTCSRTSGVPQYGLKSKL